MREESEMCLKIPFFGLSWCFLRLEDDECGQKRCEEGVRMCQGQTGKTLLKS